VHAHGSPVSLSTFLPTHRRYDPDVGVDRSLSPRCPTYGRRTDLLSREAVFFDPSGVWEEQEEVRLADYALMTSGPEGRGTEAGPYWRWPGPPLSLAAVCRPAESVHLLDGWTTTGYATLGQYQVA
jgi:hypothetical protein